MFKDNNKDTRTTPIDIFHTFSVSIVNFKHVIAGLVPPVQAF